MTAADQIRLLCVLGPIIGLLVLGVIITARSGIATLANGQGARLLVQNLTRTIVLVSFCLLGLAVLQQLLGVPRAMLS